MALMKPEISAVNVFINQNPLEEKQYQEEIMGEFNEACLKMRTFEKRNLEKLSCDFVGLLNSETLINFKVKVFFRANEYESAEQTMKDAIENLRDDLSQLEIKLMDLYQTNNRILDDFRVSSSFFKNWMKDVKLEIGAKVNLKNSFASFEEIQETLQDVKKQLEVLRDIIEFIKELKTKPYLTKINQIFPPNPELAVHYTENAQYKNVSDKMEKELEYFKKVKTQLSEFQAEQHLNSIMKDNFDEEEEKLNVLKLEFEQQLKKLNIDINDKDDEINQTILSIAERIKELQDQMREKKEKNMEACRKKLENLDEEVGKNSFDEESFLLKKPIHIFLVIDVSGSMTSKIKQKTRYQAVKEACDKMIQNRANKYSEDIVTIIEFDHAAYCTNKRIPVSKLPTLPGNPRGGGTNYNKAIEELKKNLELSPKSHTPMVLFLTDGESDTSQAKLDLKEIYKCYSGAKFVMFFVAVALDDGNFSNLE